MAAPIPISSLAPPAPIVAPAPASPASSSGAEAFQSVFASAVAKVEGFQATAAESVERLLSGEGEELHQVALASQHAALSFDLFMAVRNKVVAAYQEVMRMQV